MSKNKLTLEYPLKNASAKIIWNAIGSAQGLTKWFSDGITIKDNIYTFHWEKSEQQAFLLQSKANESIRFQWIEDDNTEVYFEMKISIIPITKESILTITDFANSDETEDLIMLWNQQIENLKRKIGLTSTT